MGNVATWADAFRNQPNQGWSAQLHYVDPLDGPPPESCAVHEMDCPEGGCIMSALANYVSKSHLLLSSPCLTCRSSQTARVQDNTLTSGERTDAMRFIIHFMGDIAQPLHTEEFGLGGNNLSVTFKGYRTNMVSFQLIVEESLLTGMYSMRHGTPPSPTPFLAWHPTPILQWTTLSTFPPSCIHKSPQNREPTTQTTLTGCLPGTSNLPVVTQLSTRPKPSPRHLPKSPTIMCAVMPSVTRVDPTPTTAPKLGASMQQAQYLLWNLAWQGLVSDWQRG